MKKTILLILAMGALAATAVATTGTADGLSYNSATGGTGHFDGVMHGGAYPYTLTSPNSQGWSNEGSPTQFYTALRGAYSYLAVYDYDDYTWILASGSFPSLTVIADFEMWYSEAGNAQEVYFHQGAGLSGPQQAFITFNGDGNNGEWWGISKGTWAQTDQYKADHLVFLENGFGNTDPGMSYPGDVPITWELSQDNGGTWQTGQWLGGNNQTDWGYFWLLNGNGGPGGPGPFAFQLRITINPSARQNDGRYYLDPNLIAKPVL